jgi:hypothetical protein
MRFRVATVAEGGDDDDDDGVPETVLAMFLGTPNRRETRRSVDKFFRDSAATLTRLEHVGGKIFWISVLLHDVGELLGPTSHFLEALCTFLQDFAFAVAEDRTYVHPLRLSVEVAEVEAENNVDRSDPAIAEVASRICRAFWENERFRAAEVVHIDLPAAPNRDTIGLFFRGRTHNTTI